MELLAGKLKGPFVLDWWLNFLPKPEVNVLFSEDNGCFGAELWTLTTWNKVTGAVKH